MEVTPQIINESLTALEIQRRLNSRFSLRLLTRLEKRALLKHPPRVPIRKQHILP